jgi:hypothetical protein
MIRRIRLSSFSAAVWLFVGLFADISEGFTIQKLQVTTSTMHDLENTLMFRTSCNSCTRNGSRLFSSPPAPRQPRRKMQKRRSRRRTENSEASTDDFPWDTAESRPLILSTAKEAGEDYWIDEAELERERMRKEQIKARDPGQVPDEKLWKEVLSPYRQNWIGLISVTIIVFAFIFKNFPEIIDPPIISDIPSEL